MPRKMRQAKARRSTDVAALADRAKWGGILLDVEPLTDEEPEEWQAWRRSLPTWSPQAALRYLWVHIDPIHGSPWSWTAFVEALSADREDVEDVIGEHPDQVERLREWLQSVESIGRRREGDNDPRASLADYYSELSRIGYDASRVDEED